MSKKLDVTKISNELKSRSLHFAPRQPVPNPPVIMSEEPPASEELPSPPVSVVPPSVQQETSREETTVSKETEKQVSLETNQQRNSETRKQVAKETKKLGNKSLKRYATYLSEDAILAMQKIAFETRRKDYEVFGEAVEKYIKRHGE